MLIVLRPTVAAAVYITLVAHALDTPQAWRERLAAGDGSEDMAFVEQMRRHYPFVTAVAAILREGRHWRSHRFLKGRRVLLDLYGTNHDSRYWDDTDASTPSGSSARHRAPWSGQGTCSPPCWPWGSSCGAR